MLDTLSGSSATSALEMIADQEKHLSSLATGKSPSQHDAATAAQAISVAIVDGGPHGQTMEVGEMDAEVYVLGLPMHDPAVLKGVQAVLAFVWVDLFIVVRNVVAISWENIYHPFFYTFLAMWSCGYCGIRHNSSKLLRLFAGLTLFHTILWGYEFVCMAQSPPGCWSAVGEDACHSSSFGLSGERSCEGHGLS